MGPRRARKRWRRRRRWRLKYSRKGIYLRTKGKIKEKESNKAIITEYYVQNIGKLKDQKLVKKLSYRRLKMMEMFWN